MYKDPVENIIKILYGELEGKIYSLVKSNKNITIKELNTILNADNKADINSPINQLIRENFLKSEKTNPNIKSQYKGKGEQSDSVLKLNNDFNFDDFNIKYRDLKEYIINYFKEEEDNKWICQKCQQRKNENLASRENFTCPKCNEHYILKDSNLSDLKKKCFEILEFLDENFDTKLNVLKGGNYSNNNRNYLIAKYGINILNTNIPERPQKEKDKIYIEENDPYIESTLEDIMKTEKSAERFAFYELIEAFNKYNKK